MPPLNQFLIIGIYISAAILVAYLGRRRKWGYWGYLWSSILFTPLLGLLFVLAADPAPKKLGKESPR
ncbi:MAG: hypothetical protein LJE69_00130 [Thiohalocapsa sp.]|jgi:hypothetical protein|uniref:hypothetical protein n=1 Tax=Thiohalocapsa sp. TaxID=2497641 RepID=UPI0025ECA949|nr:hypothetical protein [Thiohalocapsa sp.]MCG6939644.1 hypothetical protein [Thiohalocapsa sp.]